MRRYRFRALTPVCNLSPHPGYGVGCVANHSAHSLQGLRSLRPFRSVSPGMDTSPMRSMFRVGGTLHVRFAQSRPGPPGSARGRLVAARSTHPSPPVNGSGCEGNRRANRQSSVWLTVWHAGLLWYTPRRRHLYIYKRQLQNSAVPTEMRRN